MGCCTSRDPYIPNKNNSAVSSKPQAGTGFKPPGLISTDSKATAAQDDQLSEATRLFSEDKFAEAAAIYRNYLEDHCDEAPKVIDGLGQTLISLGYFEWHLFKHYKEGIEKKQYVGTVYDALSLCCQALKTKDVDEFEKGVKWYKDMVDDYPDNYAIIMGYANMLCNECVF